MKQALFIPPAIAVLVAGVLLAGQRSSIMRIEEETVILRRLIASARNPAEGSPGARLSRPSRLKPDGPIDWRNVARQVAESRRGAGDMRASNAFNRRLEAMTAEEIIAALDGIELLNLDREAGSALETTLLGALISKDPETALNRFLAIDNTEGFDHWQMGHGLKQWAAKDLGKATAWLDAQIRQGRLDSKSLDGRNHRRSQFEGQIIHAMLGIDPQGAGSRLEGMSVEARKDVLNVFFPYTGDARQKAYADAVRSQIPEDDHAGILASRIHHMSLRGGGYGKVDDYLDRIEARPRERKEVAERAATNALSGTQWKQMTPEKIDGMRDWLAGHSPESVDRVTGQAIARAGGWRGGNSNFHERAALIESYHEAGAGDELVTSFLTHSDGRAHKEDARRLAGRINDPDLRRDTLKNLE